jgi:hypothetical protein
VKADHNIECDVSEVHEYDSDPEVEELSIPATEFEESRTMDADSSEGKVLRKRALPIERVGRVGQNVYEVFQVQPARSMQRDVLIKNDGGSQLTFCDPVLFAYGVKAGFVTNVRDFQPEEMLGIGGTSVVNTMGDMSVCIEGSLVKVKIQVIVNAAISDRNYQVLLGTDNLQHLGGRIDMVKRVTEYATVPGVGRVLESMHLAPASATRVFNARRVCSDSAERPDYMSPRWNRGARLDRELADIQEKSGCRSRYLDGEEENNLIDKLASEDTGLLGILVDAVEKAVRSGDKRRQREACKLLGIGDTTEKQDERDLMKRMARAHSRFYGDSVDKSTAAGDSFTFEYERC